MKRQALLAAVGLLFLLQGVRAADPIRLLVVTGGHDFQTNEFLAMFRENAEVKFRHVNYPDAQSWFRREQAGEYDVMVFYDMWPEMSAAAQKDLLDRVREGKGLVALHHTLAAHPKWPGYADLIGGKYHLEKRVVGGAEVPGSTYLHDVTFRVEIVDANHPVTEGMKDFEIRDETYGGFEVKEGAVPLLKTREKTSGPVIGWARNEGSSRVVYLQLGHDRYAFENPNYRRLLSQAIRWVARK